MKQRSGEEEEERSNGGREGSGERMRLDGRREGT